MHNLGFISKIFQRSEEQKLHVREALPYVAELDLPGNFNTVIGSALSYGL